MILEDPVPLDISCRLFSSLLLSPCLSGSEFGSLSEPSTQFFIRFSSSAGNQKTWLPAHSPPFFWHSVRVRKYIARTRLSSSTYMLREICVYRSHVHEIESSPSVDSIRHELPGTILATQRGPFQHGDHLPTFRLLKPTRRITLHTMSLTWKFFSPNFLL